MLTSRTDDETGTAKIGDIDLDLEIGERSGGSGVGLGNIETATATATATAETGIEMDGMPELAIGALVGTDIASVEVCIHKFEIIEC
jgi:hypothetical protein